MTSGVRIGTPALTTRGMKEGDMKTIAAWIGEVLNDAKSESTLKRIKGQVRELCLKFPIYRQ